MRKALFFGTRSPSVSLLALATLLVACGSSRNAATGAAPSAKWTLKLERITSALALGTGDTVYVLLVSGLLHAIDSSGKIKWSKQAAMAGKFAVGPAVATDGAIYVVGHNQFSVFDATGGTRVQVSTGTWAGGYGVALTEHRLYAACMRAGTCAMNVDNGVDFMWHISSEGVAPIVHADGTVVLSGGNTVISIDAASAMTNTPEARWIFPAGVTLTADDEHMNWFDISPPSQGDRIAGVSAGNDGTTYVLDRMNPGSLIAFDAFGKKKWEAPLNPSVGRQPVIGADGTVYALAADGKVRWKCVTSHMQGQPLLGSAGTIFFTDANALRAIGPDGRERWRANLDSTSAVPGTLSDDGTLYVPLDSGTVYAFPVGERLMSSAWPKFQANARNSGQANP